MVGKALRRHICAIWAFLSPEGFANPWGLGPWPQPPEASRRFPLQPQYLTRKLSEPILQRSMTRSITDEIKQTRPFRTRSQEATVALMRTVHLLRRQADAVVAAEGITLQQFNVLRILRGAKAPLPTMEISERMIEPSPGITRLICTLEERGLVKREQWAGDRRQVLCQITSAGLRVLDRLEEPVNALDDRTTGSIPAEHVETLLDLLGEIRENLEKKP